ncbi:MAG TPA: cytochrome C oxidase subunit IV family protein [Terriglobales bacterium]
MATVEGHGMGKYVAVYLCLLVLMALQFFIGYQNIEGSRLVVRMLTFAIIETILVVVFFMNLGLEKRLFVKFVVFFTLFVLLTFNYGWTDSFRLLLFRLTGFEPS